jgi:hypothetical protein
MCRYAMQLHKWHFACFECRKAFKRKLLIDLTGKNDYQVTPAKCPQCGSLMANMGKDFEAPKMTDIKVWDHVKTLYEVGITFHSCGCSGPGYIPRNKVALTAYLKELKFQYQEQLEFWRNRKEPGNKKEADRDRSKNWQYISQVPYGERSDNKIVLNEEAKVYWIGRIKEVEQKLDSLVP